MLNLERRRHLLAMKVKVVFADAKIAPALMAKEMARVLDIGISQAYRKLNGHTDFTLPQIAAIEQEFGVELIHVSTSANMLAKIESLNRWVVAEFEIGEQLVRCNIVVGLAWREPARRPFAAYVERGHWRICLAGKYHGPEPLFEVDELNYYAVGEVGEEG